MKQSTEAERLFFCVTPLNILIAQAIRSLSPGRDTLVYVPSIWSPKYQFYYNRFEWDRKVCAATNPGPLPDLAYQAIKTVKVMNALKARHFDELVFGNIGSLTFSTIAKRYGDAPIATYDDGTLHADAETHANWLQQEPASHRWYRRLTGASTNEAVLARVRRHYTIFPPSLCGLDVPEVIEIPLFADLKAPGPASPAVKILLGTPETQNSLGIDDAAYERLVSTVDPDIYLPHPRERRKAAIRLPTAQSARLREAAELLAAEDFVREVVRLGYNPAIEGFGSTALLNLSRQFATKTYFPSHRPPQPIFARLGVATEPLESLLGLHGGA